MITSIKRLTFKQLADLAHNISMREYNFDSFWEDFRQMRDNRYKTPKFVSGYEARKSYGFTDYVLNSLIKDELIRTNGETPPKYALEDLLLMQKIRDQLAKLESVEMTKETLIQGKNKYLVMDLFKRGKSLDKYQAEAMTIMHQDFYGDIYHFVPKDLPVEEKKKYFEKLITELDK